MTKARVARTGVLLVLLVAAAVFCFSPQEGAGEIANLRTSMNEKIRNLWLDIVDPAEESHPMPLKTVNLKPPLSLAEYKKYSANPAGLQKRNLVSDETERTYYVYVPRSAAGKASLPAIILLHGAGRTGVSMADSWRKLAERQGVILIAPDADLSWGNFMDKNLVEKLLDIAKRDYKANPDKVYLFGHSMGGIGVLEIGPALSRDIAAFSVHAGLIQDDDAKDVIRRARHKRKACLFFGTKDTSFPLRFAGETAQFFADAGYDTTIFKIEGHDHWYYTLADWINEQAWRCMTAG